MDKSIKITQSELNSVDMLSKIRKAKDKTIDLSELNIFDAAKMIVMISSYSNVSVSKKEFKYKLPTSHVKNLLESISTCSNLEFV